MCVFVLLMFTIRMDQSTQGLYYFERGLGAYIFYQIGLNYDILLVLGQNIRTNIY